MKRISKIAVMLVILLVVVSLATVVKASTSDLVNYVKSSHNLNGMLWELKTGAKNTLEGFIVQLDDGTSDSILKDIKAAEKVVIDSHVTNHNDLSNDQKAKIVAYAKSAASKAGGELDVDLGRRTYSLKKGSTVILSGKIDDVITDPGQNSSNSSAAASATTKSGKTLLYTGANYIAYVLAAVAIVAVAVVVKRRS